MSNIWWNDTTNSSYKRYSVWVPAYSKFYWPHSNVWADNAYGTDGRVCSGSNSSGSGWSCTSYSSTVTGTPVQLSYAELWARTPLQVNVDKNYDPWMNDSQARNEWNYGVRNEVNASAKNSRTDAICSAAKAQGIIVFTIGFEAPYNGRTVLKNCASSDAHYFDVKGLEISEAFASIATSIRKLRLTQ